MNDQMKTIPYAAPWNYFTLQGFQDMQDIIFRLITDQHQLDGVVFLQPSLGLYEKIILNYYQTEITDQGYPQYLNDFYQNIKLESMATNLFFMGGEDNSQYKSKLLNYLQQVYNQPTVANNWMNANYTACPRTGAVILSDKSARSTSSKISINTKELLPATQNTCIRYNFTNYDGGAVGFDLTWGGAYLMYSGFTIDVLTEEYTYNVASPDPRRNASFFFGQQDIIEVQFEYQSFLVRFKKLYQENNQQASIYLKNNQTKRTDYGIQYYTSYTFTAGVLNSASILQIAFPFMFSQTYKHPNYSILGHRHLQLAVNDASKFYFGQVEPSINQAENNVTLNFYILYLTPGKYISLGVCDRDRIQKYNHQGGGLDEYLGVYVLYSHGQKWQNQTANTYVGKKFDQFDLVSVTYWRSNNSVLYYKNKTYLYSFSINDNVKNLNFCLSMNGQYSTVYLEY